MTATRQLYETLSFIGSTWPKDKLRLDANFGQSIIRAAERTLTADPPSSAPPPQTTNSQGVTTRLNSRTLSYRELGPEETEATKKAIAALQEIKKGTASIENPFPQSLARPASNPEYYFRLGRMLEQAAKGEQMQFTWRQRLRLFFGLQM